MERKLIKNLKTTENVTISFILILSGIIALVSNNILSKTFSSDNLFISLAACFFIPLLIFTIVTIILLIIYANIVKKIKEKKIKYAGYNFYKIGDKYYSDDWNVKKKSISDEIVSLNQRIEICQKYYLESGKIVEISKEQYDELLKVTTSQSLPLLMLTEDEYNAFVNSTITSFAIK